jgi:hypothetical protein
MLASYSQALGQAGSVAAMALLNGQAVTQVLPTNTCPVGQEFGMQLSPFQVSSTAQASWQSGLVEGMLASYSQALGQAWSISAIALLNGQVVKHAPLINTCPVGQEVITQVVPFQVCPVGQPG